MTTPVFAVRNETLSETLERTRLEFRLRRTERALEALRDRLSHYAPDPVPLALHAAIRDFQRERITLTARLAAL